MNSSGDLSRYSTKAHGIQLDASEKALLWLAAEQDADFTSRDSFDQTPLFKAASRGYYKIVQTLLVTEDANLEFKDKYGWTPLWSAIISWHREIVKLLLEKGADVESKDESGQTPLFLAASEGNREAVQLLVEYGANVNSRDSSGRTPLWSAIVFRHTRTARLLIEHGANLNLRDRFGQTPLWAAIKNGHQEIVQLLIEGNTDIVSKDSFGQTPLSLAASEGHREIVRLLVEKGVDLNFRDRFGWTPLSWAVQMGHVNTVRMLLGLGAHCYHDDWSRAAKYDQMEMMQLLIEKVADEPKEDMDGVNGINLQPIRLERDRKGIRVKDKLRITKPRKAYYRKSLKFLQKNSKTKALLDSRVTKYSNLHGVFAPTPDEDLLKGLAKILVRGADLQSLSWQAQSRVSSILPQLLKSFAERLANGAPGRIQREAAILIREHSHTISEYLLWPITPFKWKSGNGESISGDEETELSDEQFMISFLQDESIPTLRRYGKIVLASPAHSWLVSSLNREADLIQAEPNIMNEIRKSILAPLPLSRRFNGVDTLPKFGVKFDIGWNPSHFFTQQFEERIPDVLASTLTLTGSFEDAQATTCMSYMQQTWPTSGAYTVELLDKVLWEPEVWNECKLPDDTAIFARIQKSELIVVVLGMRDAIAEVGEQLAWIAAALRLAPNYQGVYSCRPSIQQIRIGEDPTKLPRAIQPLSARFNVSCEISDSPTGRYSFGRCWHSLFKNPTIVHGYPIPRKARKNTGLEIPLDIMADLVQASQITTFGDKIFLKGFSSMLVLMDQIEDSIIWHLDFSHDGSYISYTDASEPPNVESIVVENIMGNIMKSRHIIGWCLKAKFYTGTDKAPYPVKKPTLQPLNDECILHGIEPPWIKSIGKHHSYHRANRERPTHLHFGENLHLRKLEKLKDQYVILWDVDSKKGWLVNGISAWLHLLRARLKHISEDGNHGPELREPSIISRYTVHSASEFFKKAENMNLPVYPNEYHGQGRPFTVMDQSNRLYDILTNLIELQGVAVRSQAYASRKYLSGWAFRDLAMEKEQFEPYVTDLPEKGRSWVDFTRGIFAVTLFGRGFGELIRPDNSCEAWSELPTGEFFLATSGQILRRIMDDVGNSPGQPWRLGKDIVWHNPTKACQCSGKAESKHADNIQVLLPEDISKDIPQSIGSEEPADNSAFVFGFNPESSWRWQEFGCPTKSTPPTSPEDFKYLTPVDSGIGSESGMSETPPCSPRLYTVGILCTLPEEGAAMKTVFDEIYDEPDHYVLGSIGNHNVALAYLPLESGIAAASTAASKLGTDFPTIKFGLLVGIAGGIPSNTTDIRLGDVVVGVPQGTHPGVIQLGRGKDLEQNGFQRTGSLNRPPTSLLSTVASMTADSQHCSLQLNNIIRTVEESGPKYQYPGQEFDILHSAPCDQCVDKCTDRGSHIPNRQSRDAAYPVVHRGLIGSGDTVIKDAQKRDELAKQYGIICVEMEAAGVMHSDIPFLVIRGISDYADAQKNDQWHSYASLTAAAFAKMLLCKVTGTDGVSRVDRRAAKRNFTYSSSPQRGMKRKLDEDSSYSSDAKF